MNEHEQERRNQQPDETPPEEVRPPGGTAERREGESALRPRIYVASLSDYNDGRLHGDWLDAGQEVEGLHSQIEAMLATSTIPHAEEWAIHDYEDFGPVRLGEYEPLALVSALGLGIAVHGEAFAALAALVDNDRDRLATFEDAYRGHWDSMAAYAEELLDDLGATAELERIPEWLQPYVEVDVAGFGRDLVLGGDVLSVDAHDGGVYVFDRER